MEQAGWVDQEPVGSFIQALTLTTQKAVKRVNEKTVRESAGVFYEVVAALVRRR